MESVKAQIRGPFGKRNLKLQELESDEKHLVYTSGDFRLLVYLEGSTVFMQPYILREEKVRGPFGGEESKKVSYRIDTLEPHKAFAKEIPTKDLSPERCNEVLDDIEEVLSTIQKKQKDNPDVELVGNFWITRGI